jgi:betaine-aldehyde dehydrogenase
MIPGAFVQLIAGEVEEPPLELDGVVEDPDDGRVLGPQRATSDAAVEDALRTAWDAWLGPGWGTMPPERRHEFLERFASVLEEEVDRIAYLEAVDTGVPLRVTRQIADAVPARIRQAAALAIERSQPRRLPAGDRRVEVTLRPLGPAALLLPWNAPAWLAAVKVGNSLAAGCPAIVKPSEHAPSSAGLFAQAAIRAELPSGALQVLHGDATLAQKLSGDARIRAVSLTGSQRAGRAIAARAAPRMASLQLELGGTNPAVVCADADVESAAAALAAGATKLNGQWCEAPRRVLVAAGLHDPLVDALRAELERLRIGTRDSEPDVGPIANGTHLARLHRQLDALGGEQMRTASIPGNAGFFMSPVLVLGVDAGVVTDEVFGPILTIHPVGDDEEAVALANMPGDGLGAYVFSRDRDHAFRVADGLQAGEIRLNGTNLLDLAPGSVQSFWGRSGIGGHGVDKVFEAYCGSRVIGEDDSSLPL